MLALLPAWLKAKPARAFGGGAGLQGIPKRGGAGKRARAKTLAVTWLPELTGNIRPSENTDLRVSANEVETELHDRWLPLMRLTRLMSLTYEELSVPMRVAFLDTFINNPRTAEADAAHGSVNFVGFTVKLFVVASLHAGRVYMLLDGSPFVYVWFAVQAIRCHKVRELVQYMGDMSADLATDVSYLSIYRFLLVLYSIPHWCDY
ncbi:hypothetical protein T492DRAFT_848656 [Pavlovales sp. CCMP2436]|nr:hypothetical protein T492DRAFT_848656 [Pavlovales sp. CCMP2436]